MSHLQEVTIKVADLEALDEAAPSCGLRLIRGQKTHAWYGHLVGDSQSGVDYARKVGTVNLGKCDHALQRVGHQPGDYEIGVVANGDGTFNLAYDSWGPGKKLEAVAEPGLNKLKREYTASAKQRKATATLAKRGWATTRENLADGRIVLRVTKR